jgi:hypothetical protein
MRRRILVATAPTATPTRCGTISQVTSRPASEQHLRDLARLRHSRELPSAVRDPAGNMVRIQELR